MNRAALLLSALLCFAAACRRPNQVGDHVLVEWRGGDYPAVIVGLEGNGKFRVHFDGYSDDWDETLPATRVKARLTATPNAALARTAPAHSAAQTSGSASAHAPTSALPPPGGTYHVGDRVRVEWHGSIYAASIIEQTSDDRYRVHYEGFGNEWDETIGRQRIQRKNN